MRLKKTRCSKQWRLALITVSILGSGVTVSIGECGPKRKKANMSIENTKKQVAEHLDVFRKTGELTELRNAANLIDRIEVTSVGTFEDRQAARTAKLSLWLRLLDSVDSAKDAKFDPADVPAARVTVPDDVPMKPGFPVRTPEGIADPAAQRKYDEAVKANAEKTRHYRLHEKLRQLDPELTAPADAYIDGANLKLPPCLEKMNATIAPPVKTHDRPAHLPCLV